MRSSFRNLAALTVVALVVQACGKEPAVEQPAPVPVAPVTAPAEPAIDPVTGFKMARDWELVRNNCIGCHSSKLITQQRGTPQQWLTMIRWMQAKQNLWQFDADTEARIIAYLSENYPPDAARRRAALPADQMPPNPYDTVSD